MIVSDDRARTGRLVAIARRKRSRALMEEIEAGSVSTEKGLDGDYKGARYRNRQITILARDDWDAAAAEAGAPDAPWTVRRANLLVEGLRLPRAKGAILRIGDVTLEVTGQTYPCRLMEEALPGLLKSMARDWRGGLTTRVLTAGDIRVGDHVEIESAPPDEKPPRLP